MYYSEFKITVYFMMLFLLEELSLYFFLLKRNSQKSASKILLKLNTVQGMSKNQNFTWNSVFFFPFSSVMFVEYSQSMNWNCSVMFLSSSSAPTRKVTTFSSSKLSCHNIKRIFTITIYNHIISLHF